MFSALSSALPSLLRSSQSVGQFVTLCKGEPSKLQRLFSQKISLVGNVPGMIPDLPGMEGYEEFRERQEQFDAIQVLSFGEEDLPRLRYAREIARVAHEMHDLSAILESAQSEILRSVEEGGAQTDTYTRDLESISQAVRAAKKVVVNFFGKEERICQLLQHVSSNPNSLTSRVKVGK